MPARGLRTRRESFRKWAKVVLAGRPLHAVQDLNAVVPSLVRAADQIGHLGGSGIGRHTRGEINLRRVTQTVLELHSVSPAGHLIPQEPDFVVGHGGSQY